MWNNHVRNIKPDQAELIDMGLPTDDSAFNIEDCTVKKLSKVCLNG